jgi:hypothetical protein
MRAIILAAAAAALLLLTLAAVVGPATHAQTGVQVQESTAQVDFPAGIAFSLRATADAQPDEVRLNYRVAPDGVRANAIAQCSGAATFSCSYQLASTPANILIPGAVLTYSWTVSAGDTNETTPDQTITYEDTRFDWRSLTQGNMTLWYYAGGEDAAQAILDAAYASQQASSALLQTTVDYPVKVFLYGSAEDMQLAIQSNNDEGVVTLGEVVYSDTAMVAADSAPEEIARHEVAHIVQRAALDRSYRPPDWVIEGMAVYMQSEPLGGQRGAIESAIEDNTVLSVRSMSSASSGAISGNVFLFYGEAWSLVNFLVETYGEQKFADYFRAINDGAGEVGALEQVYGFNQDGLENAWRASVGLPPRSAPTPADDEVAEPTSIRQPETSTARDDGTNFALIAGIIAITAAMAGALVVFGVWVARRLSL